MLDIRANREKGGPSRQLRSGNHIQAIALRAWVMSKVLEYLALPLCFLCLPTSSYTGKSCTVSKHVLLYKLLLLLVVVAAYLKRFPAHTLLWSAKVLSAYHLLTTPGH